jgi:hypothetical protein
MRSALYAGLLWLGLTGWPGAQCRAQPAAPAQPPAEAAVPQRGGEPKVQLLVSEDDHVRIEELRVRGITRRVSVQPKLPGVPAYAIGPNADGRDASQDRRTEGRALWQLLSF